MREVLVIAAFFSPYFFGEAQELPEDVRTAIFGQGRTQEEEEKRWNVLGITHR